MKVFRDLKLIGSVSEQEKLIDRIEQNLTDGWIRDKKREADPILKEYHICMFTRPKTASYLETIILFSRNQNNYLYVNGLTYGETACSIDVHNSILEDFLTRFIEPAVQGLEIEIFITPVEKTIDNAMSPELTQLLKQFSGAANKSSAGSHPADERRFFDFIVQAHIEGSLLNETELKGLLIDDGWIESFADSLSGKYRFGRDLLNRYAEHNPD